MTLLRKIITLALSANNSQIPLQPARLELLLLLFLYYYYYYIVLFAYFTLLVEIEFSIFGVHCYWLESHTKGKYYWLIKIVAAAFVHCLPDSKSQT